MPSRASYLVWRVNLSLQILGRNFYPIQNNTVILLGPYCGSITEPGLPMALIHEYLGIGDKGKNFNLNLILTYNLYKKASSKNVL